MEDTYSILHIEDCPLQKEIIKKTLPNFNITPASSLKEAHEKLALGNYDLILLDILLSDGESFSLCKQIKASPPHAQTPVLILSGHSDISNKLLTFDLGADDFLSKPFHPLELQARIRLLLRRHSGKGPETSGVLRYGPLSMDPASLNVYISQDNQQSQVFLTATEFKLLSYFIKNAGRVLSREQILDTVWGHGCIVTDRNVDAKISRLRKKLGEFGNWLGSIYGMGYCLSQPPESRRTG